MSGMSDPIADLLTRVRNGYAAKRDVVVVPASKLKIALTAVLKQEGFIDNLRCVRDGKQGVIKIALRYSERGEAAIRGVRRVSTSSRRVYKSYKDLRPVRNGFGIAVVSTSKGLMTDADARTAKLGGEVLCHVH